MYNLLIRSIIKCGGLLRMENQLSIVVPIYKVERYLFKCLDSIVNQTFTDMEIILIDDGSPDNCGKICDEYAQKDSRIIVIHKNNEGLCAARNEGIRKATGKWIAFVDSDDWCETDYYENLFCELNNREVDVFMAGGHYLEYEEQQVPKYNFRNPFYYDERKDLDFLMAKVLAPQCGTNGDVYAASAGSPWDKLYRSEFIKANNLWFDEDSKAWEDLLFNFYVFDKAKTVAGGVCFGYHYRMIMTSITKNYNPQREKINYMFIDKLSSYMEKRDNSELIQNAIYCRSLNMISNLFSSYYFNKSNKLSYHEVVEKVKAMKRLPYYYKAIHCKRNKLLSKRQQILKLLLRLPCVWILGYASNTTSKKRH